MMTRPRIRFFSAATGLLLAGRLWATPDGSGSITADPNPCPVAVGDTLCTSLITVASSGLPQAQVWVSMDGAGAETLFSCGTSGTQDAGFIQAGHTYTFSMYASADCTVASKGRLITSTVVTGTNAPQEPPSPLTATFSANSTTITSGQSTTLSWTTSNATSVSIDNGIGPVALNGNQSVRPAVTTTYTLTVTGSGGTITQQVTITVNPAVPPSLPTPTATFTADSTLITAGQFVTLFWTTTNATSVSIDNGIGPVVLNGSKPVGPLVTTTYTLTATGASGMITPQVTITVNPAPAPPTANPQTVTTAFQTAKAITLTGSDPNNLPLTYAITANPLHGTLSGTAPNLTYTPVNNFAGADSFAFKVNNGFVDSPAATVSVTVGNPPAPIATFTASSTTITAGQSTTLSWTTTNAATVSIDNGIGSVGLSGSQLVSPSVTTTYTLTVSGPGGTITKQVSIMVTPAPPTATFTVSSTTITVGQSTTLSWTTTNATSVSIDNGVGSVATSGSRLVSPSVTTTYTLTVTGPGGTITEQVIVSVNGPTPTVATFTASSTTMTAGQSVALSWTTSNASSVSIDNGVGSVALNGSQLVSPLVTTTYNLTVIGLGGTITEEVTITVNPAPPTATFSASSTTITAGQSSTLSWTTTNATAVSIDNGIGPVGLSGSQLVSPVSTSTYTLTVTGPGGTITKQVTITVNPVPTATFSASSTTITSGQSTTLSWTTTNATTVSIDNGIGAVGLNDSQPVTPVVTSTYTLTVTGLGGTITKQVTVTVNPAPPTATFTVSPAVITAGQSSTLFWATTNATSVSIDHGIGSVSASGNQLVSPTVTTTYTLTVTGPGGTIMEQVIVSVNGPTPPSATFTASSTTMTAGQLVTLSWMTSNATSVSIDNGIGSVGLNGSQLVSPLVMTTYNLTVIGPGGTITEEVAVTVNPAPPAPPASVGPTITSVTANPNPVTGAQTTLSVVAQDPGAANLTYSWTSMPADPARFKGSTNTASIMAYFTQPGSYLFNVTVQDDKGLSTTGSVTVTVPEGGSGLPSSITASDFSLMKVFPNPWRADRPMDGIHFENLPAGSTVKIFALSSRWVQTLAAPNGEVTWALKNDAGGTVASGLYFYLATNPKGDQARGTLAVVK